MGGPLCDLFMNKDKIFVIKLVMHANNISIELITGSLAVLCYPVQHETKCFPKAEIEPPYIEGKARTRDNSLATSPAVKPIYTFVSWVRVQTSQQTHNIVLWLHKNALCALLMLWLTEALCDKIMGPHNPKTLSTASARHLATGPTLRVHSEGR